MIPRRALPVRGGQAVVLLLRGLWYRAGRSAVVAALATVAVAAAVLVPGFTQAAQQSVLTDRLAAAPAAGTGLTLAASGTAAATPAAHQPTDPVRSAVGDTLADHPELAGVLAPAVGGLDTGAVVTGGSEPVASRLAHRDRVCEHLLVTGDCPTEPGEVLVSARTADAYRIATGDRLTVRLAQTSLEVTVVGSYAPIAPAAAYWGRTVYFTHGGFDPASGAARGDALFTGAEDDVQADPAAVVDLALTYPVRPGAVRLDQLGPLRVDLAALPDRLAGLPDAGALQLDTALPAVLDEVDRDRAAIGRTVPVVAVPLLLLVGFVLFLLVAAVTEERGREIALARLRGFPGGRTARFGLGEVLVLLAAATPVGIAAGLGAVELAARARLAEGTHAALRWPVLAAAAGALAVAALAALLAGRATLRRPVLDLLRRVPERSRTRAGMVDGALVVLAAGSLVVAAADPTAPLALLAPALVALVAGVATARLVQVWSAARLRRAARRGRARVAGLLAAAQLARRPAGARVAVVLTVAVGLLAFAALAWDTAAAARRDHATDALGADRVYTVHAGHPAALVEAVHAADPAGTAMAVVRATGQYAGEPVPLLAVDTPRLAGVAQWRDYPVAAGVRALRPAEPRPLRLTGEIEVAVRVRELGPDPVRLTALVSAPGEPPAAVPLGTLDSGAERYAAALPGCATGCRLLGLGLGRAGVPGPVDATIEVTSIRSGAGAGGAGGADAGGELPARFDDPQAWRVGTGATLTPGTELTVATTGTGDTDMFVEYQDTPAALPVVLAGPAPAEDPAATEFPFPGLAERPEPFTVVDRADRLPRAGVRGLLFDLGYAVGSAERRVALSDSTGLRYEVWAGPAAPPDLPRRLAEHGVPVLQTESVAGAEAQLGRQAPALALGLSLLAAAAALVLALGVVALATRVGAADRYAERAALRVAGVSARVLRRAAWREHAIRLGGPLLVGAGTGVVAGLLLLPGVPLVEAGGTVGDLPAYRLWPGVLPVALAAAAAGLVLVAALPGRPPEGGLSS
ncbi:MAG: FtsX-like permease family protein [Micromonosporaceae bacterium]|nr:FtsX-like permease family protein [Micromonosporaceae bacterium]